MTFTTHHTFVAIFWLMVLKQGWGDNVEFRWSLFVLSLSLLSLFDLPPLIAIIGWKVTFVPPCTIAELQLADLTFPCLNWMCRGGWWVAWLPFYNNKSKFAIDMLLLSVILLQIPTSAGYKHTCDLWSWRSRDLLSFWRMLCVLSEQMLIFLRITDSNRCWILCIS